MNPIIADKLQQTLPLSAASVCVVDTEQSPTVYNLSQHKVARFWKRLNCIVTELL